MRLSEARARENGGVEGQGDGEVTVLLYFWSYDELWFENYFEKGGYSVEGCKFRSGMERGHPDT